MYRCHNTTPLLLWHLRHGRRCCERCRGGDLHRWTALSASVPAHSNTSRHPVGGRGGGTSEVGRLTGGSSWHRWRTCSPEKQGVISLESLHKLRPGHADVQKRLTPSSKSGSRVQAVVPRNQLWLKSVRRLLGSKHVRVCVCVCSDHLGRWFFFHPVFVHPNSPLPPPVPCPPPPQPPPSLSSPPQSEPPKKQQLNVIFFHVSPSTSPPRRSRQITALASFNAPSRPSARP